MLSIIVSVLLGIGALIGGAAWRRWFGSARADVATKYLDPWWQKMFRVENPKRRFPWRGMQVVIGCIGLYGLGYLGGDTWWRAGLETAAAMVIFTISAHTRDPFIWMADKLRLPQMWGTMLNGPDPWGEALQGALIFVLVALI